ncbi:MAG: hypothetical protein RJA69_655 [Pseudomonadota bacterium]
MEHARYNAGFVHDFTWRVFYVFAGGLSSPARDTRRSGLLEFWFASVPVAIADRLA